MDRRYRINILQDVKDSLDPFEKQQIRILRDQKEEKRKELLKVIKKQNKKNKKLQLMEVRSPLDELRVEWVKYSIRSCEQKRDKLNNQILCINSKIIELEKKLVNAYK